MAAAVASRYARALVDVISDPKSAGALTPESALAQLREFKAMIASSNELSSVLLSPAVAPARKRAVIAKFGSMMPLATTIRNFLYVLIDHRRTAMLGEVLDAIQSQLDERLGIAQADVTSARPLSEAEQTQIKSSFAAKTGKKIRGQFTVNPDLIGGVMVRIGSTIYDGSVRGSLDGMRRKLVSD